MTPFLRYIRPVLFDEQRAELVTQKHGGICLRFDFHEGRLWFTHSICDADTLFSKDVAKTVTDSRAKIVKGLGFVHDGWCGRFFVTKKTDVLVENVILFGLHVMPDTENFALKFLFSEYKTLATALHRMRYMNDAEEMKLNHWKSQIANADLKKVYTK